MEKGKTNPAVELLCSLFFSKPKKGVYDIPSNMFRDRAAEKCVRDVNATDCIYGEFLHESVVKDYAEDFFFDSPDFEKDAGQFRQKIIRQIIFSIDSEWLSTDEKTFDYISFDDVAEFIQLVSKNRIWSDADIKKAKPVLREYVMGAMANPEESTVIEEDIREIADDEVSTLEREARIKCIDKDYIPYVEGINLDKLKLLLKDNLQRSFVPYGRQKDALVSLKRFNFIAASRRCGKCEDPNARIRMADLSIKLAKNVVIGDKLLASDKKNEVIVEEKEVFRKKKCKITLSNGMEQIVSFDHRIPTQKNFSIDGFELNIDNYKQANQLVPGEDMVPTMFNIGKDCMSSEKEVEEAKLIGYMIGDGCLSQGLSDIAIHSTEWKEYIENILSVLGFKNSYNKESNILRVLGSTSLMDKYPEIYKKSIEKTIPDSFFKKSKNVKFGLIEGMLNSDGYLQIGKKGLRIELCSVSEDLIRRAQDILADIGIISYIRSKKIRSNFKSSNSVARYLYISDSKSLIKLFSGCDLSNKKNFEEAKRIVGLKTNRTNSNIGTVPLCAVNESSVKGIWHKQTTYNGIRKPRHNFQRWKCENLEIEHRNKYAWMKVVSVEMLDEDDVIHLKVSGDSTYWDGSILTHNTMLGAYLAARQIYIPNQTIIYVVPILRVQAKVSWRYLTAMLKNNPQISFNKSDWTITNRANGSEIQFLSGERDTSVRAPSANLLIFDEAAFLTEELYETASALVRTTNGIVYAITTVNTKAPKNRFYYRLVKGELAKYEKDSKWMGMRVTLYNNPFINDEEKADIVEDGKHNLHMFNCEWMAEFSESDDFELSKFWIIDNAPIKYMVNGTREVKIRAEALEKHDCVYYKFLINYDCAKMSDKPGVSVIGLKHDGGADLVCTAYLSMFDYYDQVKLILGLRSLLGEIKTVMLLDYGGPGIVVEEIFRRTHNVNVIKVQRVSGTTYNRDGGIHRVGKDLMIGKMKSSMSRGMLRGFSFMDDLRLEFETYDERETREFGHHYDILNSIMYGNVYLDKIGLMTPKEKEDEDEHNNRVVGSFPEGYAGMFQGGQERDDYSRFRNGGY